MRIDRGYTKALYEALLITLEWTSDFIEAGIQGRVPRKKMQLPSLLSHRLTDSLNRDLWRQQGPQLRSQLCRQLCTHT